MSEPFFYEETNDFLSLFEVKYWKRMFLSNLKVGVEIEAENNDYDMRSIREELTRKFQPTNQFGNFGSCGVFKVVDDGSLQNGAEICTVGRRLNFLDLYSQYKFICDEMLHKDFYVNERCGLHSHILFSYYNPTNQNELEKPIPDIIMKNFFQLIRRYIPTLVWVTATGYDSNDRGLVTRYEQFCKTENLLGYTPKNRTFKQYIDKIGSRASGTRYLFCNTRPLIVTDEGTTCMHIEFRFPDGSLYPAQIVAQNILFASLFIKAIELSEIGLISTGTQEYWNETKDIYKKLRQGEGFTRHRFSAPIDEDTRAKLISRSNIMLDELKHSIFAYEPLAFQILKVLANKPIAMMRHEKGDRDINDDFKNMIKIYYKDNLEDCIKIIKTIQTQKVKNCLSENQWMYKASEGLNEPFDEIKKKMERIKKIKPYDFDTQIGLVYFK